MRVRSLPTGLAGLVALSCLACPTAEDPAGPGELQLTAMTFNVLCSVCNVAEYDPWEDRLGTFDDIFQRHDPDLIGLQELMFASEVEELAALLPGFEPVYFAQDEPGPIGLSDYPDAAIFARRDRFELLDHGFYWLSPTPDEAWSTGFSDGAQLPRLVAWVLVLDVHEQRELVFTTTHFDNNPPSQDLSAPLLLQRTEPWTGDVPVIVTGDFNSQTYDPAYEVLVGAEDGAGFGLTDSFDVADRWSQVTNVVPEPPYDTEGRIDHVFVADGPEDTWSCSSWAVDQTVYGDQDRYPSDHWPVVARLTSTW
jgi:endonuclease/exonuclease/phosphatase family metal-dependent hydrolase